MNRNGSVCLFICFVFFCVMSWVSLYDNHRLNGLVQVKDTEIVRLTKALAEKTANTSQTAEATETPTLSIEGRYNVTVTADENFIKAGKYDQVNSNINPKNFVVNVCSLGDIELLLIRVSKPMSFEDIIGEMYKISLRPGNLLELCALGAKFPDLQREISIIALGSQYNNGNCFAHTLCSLGMRRYLSLFCWSSKSQSYGDDCRFLAVRK